MRRALALGILLASMPASALTPTAQDRHVFTRRDLFPQMTHTEETKSAPDYGPFTAGVDGIIFPIEGPPNAFQSSSIESERLQATGNTLAAPDSLPGQGDEIGSQSVYSVDFVLDEPRAFTLTGQLDIETHLSGCEEALGRVALTGPGGVVAQFGVQLPGSCGGGGGICSLPLSATGELAPGSYTLEARSESTAHGFIGAHGGCAGHSTGRFAAALLLAPTVLALSAAWPGVLAVALALAARRRSGAA